MTRIGTVFKKGAARAMLLGSGELGREVVIELKRLGVEVIAVDRYADAPAMQVADRSHVISMLDPDALERVIELERPDYIVPEVEAIATSKLVELEARGWNVVPTAAAVNFTMNRKNIRTLAAEKLGMKTSPYMFASTEDEFARASKDRHAVCRKAHNELVGARAERREGPRGRKGRVGIFPKRRAQWRGRGHCRGLCGFRL